MPALLERVFPVPAALALPACGLDISDRAIKYIELLRRDGGLRLGRYGEVELEENIVKGGVVVDADRLSGALAQIVKSSGLSAFHASLPEEKAYIVQTTLPRKTENLREAIELHLEEQVPIAVAAAIFDFEIAPRAENEATAKIAISAIESKYSEAFAAVMVRAGILPLGFEFESQALARAVVCRDETDAVMTVDIGREQSNVTVVNGNVVELASSINIGGNALARAIAEDLRVSVLEAGKLKEDKGLAHRGTNEPFDSIVRVAAVLRDEMHQRLLYWNNERGKAEGKNVSEIILCGGNANIPGLLEYMSSGLSLPVAIANPWTNVLSFDEVIPELTARESLKFCTALGLALRGL